MARSVEAKFGGAVVARRVEEAVARWSSGVEVLPRYKAV
jgi:hypothetical protein